MRQIKFPNSERARESEREREARRVTEEEEEEEGEVGGREGQELPAREPRENPRDRRVRRGIIAEGSRSGVALARKSRDEIRLRR